MQVQDNSNQSNSIQPNKPVSPPAATLPQPATVQGSIPKGMIQPPSVLSQNTPNITSVSKAASPATSAKATPVQTEENKSADKNTVNPEEILGIKLGKGKGSKSKKQIPTILGLLILFVALISGVLLFGNGTGVFAPRATAQTTPKNIYVSNVTDKTFTVSFYTDESTTASIKYGETEKSLDKQANDDRDQLSGIVKGYRLHHITVRNLSPNQDYYYNIVVDSNSFDNESQAYTVKTAVKPSQASNNSQTIYGTVYNADKSPAEGAVVYLYIDGVGTLSSLIKSSGSWGISLANAFSADKSSYATISDDSQIELKFQGIEPTALSDYKLSLKQAQPVSDVVLGQNQNEAATTSDVDKSELLAGVSSASSTLDSSQSSLVVQSSTATESGSPPVPLQSLVNAIEGSTSTSSSKLAAQTTEESDVVDLDQMSESQEASATTVTTTQPQIKATLPADTVVRVVIHSDTQIDETMQTDADGNLVLDVASLGQNLEPGEHTATYTYTDPVTGQEVTKTYSFTVSDSASTRQLASATTPTPTVSIPYGSGNPYVPTTTPTPTITAAPTASVSAVSTKSATVSTASGQYTSGSVGTTIALFVGGLFFVLAGVWSYTLANSFDKKG